MVTGLVPTASILILEPGIPTLHEHLEMYHFFGSRRSGNGVHGLPSMDTSAFYIWFAFSCWLSVSILTYTIFQEIPGFSNASTSHHPFTPAPDCEQVNGSFVMSSPNTFTLNERGPAVSMLPVAFEAECTLPSEASAAELNFALLSFNHTLSWTGQIL